MKKDSKRIMALTMAALMAASITACSGGTGSSSSGNGDSTGTTGTTAAALSQTENSESNSQDAGGQEPVTLKFSWWGGDTRHEATEKAVEAFEAKYPYITVETEYGAWTGWEEKQSLNILGGNAADMMQINWNWIESYSNNGENFYDLNDFADVLDLTQFPESSMKSCVAGGKQVAVPCALTGRLVYWNKTTFDEVGCELPTDEESLLAAGAAFEAYDSEYYPLALTQYDRMIFMVHYLESKYGKAWVLDNAVQYTEEEIADGLDFINRLEEGHVIPSLAILQGDMSDSLDKNAKWIDGKYAGIFDYDSAASKFKQAVEESVNKPGQEFVIGAPLVFGDNPGGFIKISMCFAISSTCEHPKEAAMLINYLLNDPEGATICSTERGIPCSQAAVEVLNANNLGDPTVMAANAQVLVSNTFPLDAKFEHSDLRAEPDGVYYKVFGKLSSGDIDSKTGAQTLLEGVTVCLEQ